VTCRAAVGGVACAARAAGVQRAPLAPAIALEEASGCFVRDVNGNVFIDFLAGAGVLSLRHNHPEPVTAATERMGLFSHELDMPSLVKDDFTTAQLSMLPAFLSKHLTKLPTSGAGSSRGG
jgi:diaminobutyrate-2-oxoglutarate transaminase